MSRKPLALLTLAVAFSSVHAGGEEGDGTQRQSNADVSSIQLGRQLLGPPVSVEGLRGKAVLLEFWGTH